MQYTHVFTCCRSGFTGWKLQFYTLEHTKTPKELIVDMVLTPLININIGPEVKYYAEFFHITPNPTLYKIVHPSKSVLR